MPAKRDATVSPVSSFLRVNFTRLTPLSSTHVPETTKASRITLEVGGYVIEIVGGIVSTDSPRPTSQDSNTKNAQKKHNRKILFDKLLNKFINLHLFLL